MEGKTGLALAPGQADAVRAALSSKVSVITGGPGVGKTTIVNSILRILSAKGVDILLCAPTGRAAKRMSEATGLEAKTIHRLLEVDPRNGEMIELAGSIPARAGEPSTVVKPVLPVRVYPRACGGTWEDTLDTYYIEGLSPRVRGNHSRLDEQPPTPGSIPARAGEPAPRRRC